MRDISHVQKQILTKLLSSEGNRFSHLRPAGVDKDLFYYHLKFLIEKGYIRKEADTYVLTDSGKSFVTNISIDGQLTNYFKLGVFLFIERKQKQRREVFMHLRKRQPYFGDILPPAGISQYGESIADTVKRKLKEETNISNYKSARMGITRLIAKKAEQVVEDTSLHLFKITDIDVEDDLENKFGSYFWMNYEDAIVAQKKNKTHISSIAETLMLLAETSTQVPHDLYFEETVELQEL
jgi:ADP-ribose pyrophosphatase YjhB (NUDIX family)